MAASRAVVRFRIPGFHRWPDAPPPRAYLRARHRHLFHVELELELFGDDRDVEFHDLLDVARTAWGPRDQDHGSASCEMLAQRLGDLIADQYPGRTNIVCVFEDGECGARVLREKD